MNQPIESKTRKGRPKARGAALVREQTETQVEAGIESADEDSVAQQASVVPAPTVAPVPSAPKKRGRKTNAERAALALAAESAPEPVAKRPRRCVTNFK